MKWTVYQVFFSDAEMQFMWICVGMRCVVEEVSRISILTDWWLRPGKRKITGSSYGSIARQGKL